jgi:hypothetical protein
MEHTLQAKVSGFVPGVDMVDGKCDIETAHYFLQVFADGDVFTVRRTAISFVELDKDLAKRFPKLGLPEMPLYDLEGANTLKKYKKGMKRPEAMLMVDDLMILQPKLTQYVSQLMSMEAVLACDEMRTFLTEQSKIRDMDGADDDGGNASDQRVKLIVERFKGKNGEECLEQVANSLCFFFPLSK